MSNEQLAIALTRAQTIGRGRFVNIGDISCDVEVLQVAYITILTSLMELDSGWFGISHTTFDTVLSVLQDSPHRLTGTLAVSPNDGRGYPTCVHPTGRISAFL